MNKTEILKAAKWGNAVKVFKPKTIADEDLEFLLNVGRYSPSAFGLEPWNIIVLQNKKIRDLVAEVSSGAQRQLKSASHFIIFTVKKDLTPDSDYFKHINCDIKNMSPKAYELFVKNFSAFAQQKIQLDSNRAAKDWAAKQAYIALGSMMLAAAEIGIDSCPIEGFIPEKVDEILHEQGVLNKNLDTTAVMLALGYRDNSLSYSKSRRDLNEIVKIIK
jgi:nitroreductase